MAAPYQTLVDSQSKRNPCLSALKEFLRQLTPTQTGQRIISLDFIAGQRNPTRRDLMASSVRSELHQLHAVVTNSPNDPKQQILGQIFVIEDISRETVEELGSQLDIDPWFFASYIHRTWRQTTSQSPQNCTLPSRERQQNFAPLYYHRSLVFSDISSEDNQLLRKGNQHRKVLVLPGNRGTRIGLAQHSCSVLLVERKNAPWIGVILVDAAPRDEYISMRRSKTAPVTVIAKSELFVGGYEDFMINSLTMPASNNSSQPLPRGMLNDLVHYWALEPPSMFDPTRPTLQALAYFPFKIVAAEWVTYVAVMAYSIRDHEPSSNLNPDLQLELNRLSSDLRILQAWRRRVLATQEKMRQYIRFIKQRHDRHHPSNDWSALLEDYEFLRMSIDEHGQRLEYMVPVVTSLVQLVESRRALVETSNVTRLTVLALVFVPLSSVASLFSINDTWKPGAKYFWVYFAVAVPVTLIVLLVARPPVKLIYRLIAEMKRTKPKALPI